MCRYAQFTLSSRQLNYRGFPLIFLKAFLPVLQKTFFVFLKIFQASSFTYLFRKYCVNASLVICDTLLPVRFFSAISLCSSWYGNRMRMDSDCELTGFFHTPSLLLGFKYFYSFMRFSANILNIVHSSIFVIDVFFMPI